MLEWKIVGLAFFLLCSEAVTDEGLDLNMKKRHASMLSLHMDQKWVREERCEGEMCFVRCCLHAMCCVPYSSASIRKAWSQLVWTGPFPLADHSVTSKPLASTHFTCVLPTEWFFWVFPKFFVPFPQASTRIFLAVLPQDCNECQCGIILDISILVGCDKLVWKDPKP